MTRLKFLKILGLGSLTICSDFAYSEIQSVVVLWNSGSCREGCKELMTERFSQTRQIQSFEIDTSRDLAKIEWNPEDKFSYRTVKRPLQRIGVGIDKIIVKTRGTVKKKGEHYVLISDGDGTEFRLVSPDYRKPSARYLTLSPEITEELAKIADTDQIAIIEGFLYQPHRSPPLILIADRVILEKTAKKNP